jgi:N-acetylneuraminic acid mutarotase
MLRKHETAILFALCSMLAACDGDPNRDLTAPDVATPDAAALLAPSNTWQTKRPLLSARFDPGAATINNRIFLVGTAPSGAASRTLQVYDVASNTWSTGAPLPAARGQINGVSAISGRLYVTGGYNASGEVVKTLYVYETGTNTWTRKADMPEAGFRGSQGVIAGRLYVYTALHSDVEPPRFFRYNPATNRWATLPPPPNEHRDDAGSGVIGGKFYLAAGRLFGESIHQSVDVYDPATNSWTSAAPMPAPLCCAASAVVKGKLYVAGGLMGDGGGTAASLQVYDPLTNTWTSKAPMPTPRRYAAGVAAGGLVFVMTGQLTDGSMTRKVEAYTP